MELGEYKVWLKTLPTKRLLLLRRYNISYLEYTGKSEYDMLVKKNNAVFVELDTREHIPNVKEKISLRQSLGRQKRNNGQKRKQK